METGPGSPASPRPLFGAGTFWLFAIGACVLFGLLFSFAMIGARASGLEGLGAARSALAACVVSPGLPLAVGLVLLLARRRTRTREHLALGAVLILGAVVLIEARSAGRDLDRIDERQHERALHAVGELCRDCPPELGAKVCDAYCACLRERVRGASPSAFRRDALDATLATMSKRCRAEAGTGRP